MATKTREIVLIDEDKCDGCAACVLSCAEAAIQIVDGKAKLVSENLCDGFGACLGSCPQDAITIETRAAEDFDEEAVRVRLAEIKEDKQDQTAAPSPLSMAGPMGATAASIRGHHGGHGGGCPGSTMRSFAAPIDTISGAKEATGEISSTLSQWPVQMMLVPPNAPFLKGREFLLTADCCPFAYADFHRKMLKSKALLVGCPKLDNLHHYRDKLEETFRLSGCTAVTVVIMEVPCCTGLKIAAVEALKASGADIPLKEVVIGIQGKILRETALN